MIDGSDWAAEAGRGAVGADGASPAKGHAGRSRRWLWRCGRWGSPYRKNVRSLPGSPDFANKSRKWAVFVHGCFWHRHTGCRRATTPNANRDFWLAKFVANRTRDRAGHPRVARDGLQSRHHLGVQCRRRGAAIVRGP